MQTFMINKLAMIQIDNKDYITLKELALKYNMEIWVSYSRLRWLLAEGTIKNFKKIWNSIFVPLDSTLEYLKKRKNYINEKWLIHKKIKEYYFWKQEN